MAALVYSTHAIDQAAEAMIRDVAVYRVASALDDATLTREGAEADIVIVRAPIPAALFARSPAPARRDPAWCRR